MYIVPRDIVYGHGIRDLIYSQTINKARAPYPVPQGCKYERYQQFTQIYPGLPSFTHFLFSPFFFYLEIYRFYLKDQRHIWSRKEKNKNPPKNPQEATYHRPFQNLFPPPPPSKSIQIPVPSHPRTSFFFIYFHFITFLLFLGCFEVSFFSFSPEPSKVVAYITGRVLQKRAYPPVFPLPDFPYSLSYLSPVDSGFFLFLVFSVDCLPLMSP